MTPLALARRYLDCFAAGDVAGLEPLLHEALAFEGPFLHTHTAAAYLDALRAAPPQGITCTVRAAYEDRTSACLFYRFQKPGVETTMAQHFEIEAGRIRRILLVFDTASVRTEAAPG